MSRRNARVGNNGQNGENLPESLANILMRQQKERVAILAKKVYLANIRQSLIKHSNEIAKEPFKSTDFEETGEFGENSQKTLEKVNNNNKKMIKGPLPEWRF